MIYPQVPYSCGVGTILVHKYIQGLEVLVTGHTANGIKGLETTINKRGNKTKPKTRYYNKYDLRDMFLPKTR